VPVSSTIVLESSPTGVNAIRSRYGPSLRPLAPLFSTSGLKAVLPVLVTVRK